jgi:hypothetical protein
LLSIPSQLQEAPHNAPEIAWRRFVTCLFWAGVLGLTLIAALNLLVNPDGIYPLHLVPQLLWGTRPIKAAMLATATPAPQALILGSSRVMTLAPVEVERATGLRTFNEAVDSAKAEDFYVMLRYAVEVAHLKPRLLIVGCDVEAFHNQEPPHYYLQQPTLLATFLNHGVPRDWRWQQFTHLLSHQQTELSVISLYKIARGGSKATMRIGPDGKTYFDEWERERTRGDLNLNSNIEETVERFAPRYDNYTGLSEERLQYFKDTLKYAHDQQAEVVVFLTPIHPALERGLRPHGYDARKREVASALLRICANRGVRFYDFSSTRSFGGDDSHFYDGVHFDEKLASLLVAHLLPANGHAVQ